MTRKFQILAIFMYTKRTFKMPKRKIYCTYTSTDGYCCTSRPLGGNVVCGSHVMNVPDPYERMRKNWVYVGTPTQLGTVDGISDSLYIPSITPITSWNIDNGLSNLQSWIDLAKVSKMQQVENIVRREKLVMFQVKDDGSGSQPKLVPIPIPDPATAVAIVGTTPDPAMTPTGTAAPVAATTTITAPVAGSTPVVESTAPVAATTTIAAPVAAIPIEAEAPEIPPSPADVTPTLPATIAPVS